MSVGFGFLGAGTVARVALAPAVAAVPGAHLAAVASRDPARAAALRPARCYDDYAALLTDDDVVVVYVALPTGVHREWALAALAAGKHVLVEKPLGCTAAEVVEVADAAMAADRLAVEAAWWRWHPRTAALLALVADGGLGELVGVDAGFTFPLDPAPAWRWEPGGGGALLDVGCYAARALLAVAAAAGGAAGWAVRGAQAIPTPTGVDAATAATVCYGTATGRLVASFTAPEQQWLVVRGSTGIAALPGGDAFTSWRSPAALWVCDAVGARVRELAAVDAYALMVADVAAAVADGRQPTVSAGETLQVAALLDAVRAAAGPPLTTSV